MILIPSTCIYPKPSHRTASLFSLRSSPASPQSSMALLFAHLTSFRTYHQIKPIAISSFDTHARTLRTTRHSTARFTLLACRSTTYHPRCPLRLDQLRAYTVQREHRHPHDLRLLAHHQSPADAHHLQPSISHTTTGKLRALASQTLSHSSAFVLVDHMHAPQPVRVRCRSTPSSTQPKRSCQR